MPTLTPILDRVIVKPDPAPEKIASIHLPDETVDGLKQRMRAGTVVAIGPGNFRQKKHARCNGEGCIDCNATGFVRGEYRPTELKPGDRVHITMYADADLGPEGRAALTIQVDGEELLVMRESDIAGKYA